MVTELRCPGRPPVMNNRTGRDTCLINSVTVVMPVYNGSAFMAQQLDALAAQDYVGVWDVVIADNGSTDDTLVIVDRYRTRLQLAVIDVSFISLTLILPAVVELLSPAGMVVALIKPQFELQKEDIGPGGIVRNPRLHERAVTRIKTFVESAGRLQWRGVIDSPITGMTGNKEFLAWLAL